MKWIEKFLLCVCLSFCYFYSDFFCVFQCLSSLSKFIYIIQVHVITHDMNTYTRTSVWVNEPSYTHMIENWFWDELFKRMNLQQKKGELLLIVACSHVIQNYFSGKNSKILYFFSVQCTISCYVCKKTDPSCVIILFHRKKFSHIFKSTHIKKIIKKKTKFPFYYEPPIIAFHTHFIQINPISIKSGFILLVVSQEIGWPIFVD